MTQSGVHSPSAHTHHAEDGPAAQWAVVYTYRWDVQEVVRITLAKVITKDRGQERHHYKEAATVLSSHGAARRLADTLTSSEARYAGATRQARDQHLERITKARIAALKADIASLTNPTAGYERQRMNNNTAGEGS